MAIKYFPLGVRLLAVMIPVFFLPSCLGLQCFDPVLSDVILSSDSTYLETAITVSRYKKGSNYSDFVDSTTHIDTSKGFRSMKYDFAGDYEYKILLYPSRKVYTVSDFTVSSHNRGGGGIGEKEPCVNSCSYYLNNRLISVPDAYYLNSGSPKRQVHISL